MRGEDKSASNERGFGGRNREKRRKGELFGDNERSGFLYDSHVND